MDRYSVRSILKEGNDRYLDGEHRFDASATARESLVGGQFPRAVVVACSDSRVVPEAIFDAGLGELFVVRVAGNVIGATALSSVAYAVEHLKARYVLVLGHTGCGAVAAALSEESEEVLQPLLRPIREAIGEERDPNRATRRNVRYGVKRLSSALGLHAKIEGAVYDLSTGRVEWLDE